MTGTSTANLAEWLLEQIAEDERRARAAAPGPWTVNDPAYVESIDAEDGTCVVGGGRWGGEASVFESDADAMHIVHWNPARVLAECDAKRRIIARHAPRVAVEGPHEGELICGCSDGSDEFLAVAWPCADVRDVASVFAERPGYRPEWRPE